MQERMVRKGAFFAWMAAVVLVIWGSLNPQPEMPMPFASADKLYHWAGYALLGLLPFFAFRSAGAWSAALSMILMGGLLEVAQSFVPGRSPSFVDIVANTAGVFTGVTLARVMRPLLGRSRRGRS
jgi:VanZ family protein